MARRRKGQAVSGWVVIDKPAGVTSTQVVAMVRRAFDAQKAGHAGTLDPAATGVLAVALGEATKTVPHITDAMKAYRFTIRLGQSTTTDDAEGTVLATSDARPETAEIEAALAGFRGDIEQVPPQFSAVKVEGERAYDIARAGEEMELAARALHVAKLDLIARPDADHVDLEMVCGKGGYVRAIARDLGAALGCHGYVLALRRIWSGPFRVEEGITPEALLALDPDARDAYLHPLERGLHDLPEVTLSDEGAVRLRNGNPGAVLIAPARPGDTVWGSYKGQPVAVGTYLGGMLHPSRVFNL